MKKLRIVALVIGLAFLGVACEDEGPLKKKSEENTEETCCDDPTPPIGDPPPGG